jgi:hypothetical protein
LFDLETDSLCQIINRGREIDLIKGLEPVLDNSLNIINFYYVDNIFFFLPTKPHCIEVVMWDLVAFEAVSSIKINLSKTEIVPFNLFEVLSSIKINLSKTEIISLNLSTKEVNLLAAIAGCRISYFPLMVDLN